LVKVVASLAWKTQQKYAIALWAKYDAPKTPCYTLYLLAVGNIYTVL